MDVAKKPNDVDNVADDEAKPAPIPLVERWASDDMKGTKVYRSVEEYFAAKEEEKRRVKTTQKQIVDHDASVSQKSEEQQ
jgi:hypothetical protein